MRLDLRVLSERLAVCRLDPGSAMPAWALDGEFRTISWTAEETSVVCSESAVPEVVTHEPGWRALMLQGPFGFELTGVLLSVLQPLATAGIGIFAISTFDTDYVLVKESHLSDALDALRAADHEVALHAQP